MNGEKRRHANHHPYRPVINPNVYNPANSFVSYRYVFRAEYLFEQIQNLITNRSIAIDYIEEVHNEVLKHQYSIKKSEKIKQYGAVDEQFLFHGTKIVNVKSICRFNFDWRLYGINGKHKFGKGVNFSTNAKYASNYSDRGFNKVMILAKVLVAKSCDGHTNMSLPPPGHDTSHKNGGLVTVKYEDNEFYPAFVIYYHFGNPRRQFQLRLQ